MPDWLIEREATLYRSYGKSADGLECSFAAWLASRSELLEPYCGLFLEEPPRFEVLREVVDAKEGPLGDMDHEG
jgi:hypothetical protein